jgi:hypothetical protein
VSKLSVLLLAVGALVTLAWIAVLVWAAIDLTQQVF